MDRSDLLSVFGAHLDRLLADTDPASAVAAKTWRLSRVANGLAFVDYVERQHVPVPGRVVVDVACAWGGEALAFAAAGARVAGFDLHDHRFDALNTVCRAQGLEARFAVASCDEIPLPAASVDVLLALELVEHLPDVRPFAAEVARVLRPGGLALLTTPARLKSVLLGEPHFGLRAVAVLPLPLQRVIAFRLLGRRYPYPVTAQYVLASQVLRPFARLGLLGAPQATGRLAARLTGVPLASDFYRQVAWNFLVVEKPGGSLAGRPG